MMAAELTTYPDVSNLHWKILDLDSKLHAPTTSWLLRACWCCQRRSFQELISNRARMLDGRAGHEVFQIRWVALVPNPGTLSGDLKHLILAWRRCRYVPLGVLLNSQMLATAVIEPLEAGHIRHSHLLAQCDKLRLRLFCGCRQPAPGDSQASKSWDSDTSRRK